MGLVFAIAPVWDLLEFEQTSRIVALVLRRSHLVAIILALAETVSPPTKRRWQSPFWWTHRPGVFIEDPGARPPSWQRQLEKRARPSLTRVLPFARAVRNTPAWEQKMDGSEKHRRRSRQRQPIWRPPSGREEAIAFAAFWNGCPD